MVKRAVATTSRRCSIKCVHEDVRDHFAFLIVVGHFIWVVAGLDQCGFSATEQSGSTKCILKRLCHELLESSKFFPNRKNTDHNPQLNCHKNCLTKLFSSTKAWWAWNQVIVWPILCTLGMTTVHSHVVSSEVQTKKATIQYTHTHTFTR